ncbi:hypothetical protein C8F04DRAFT_1151872 [Mycena alexandri]|uniref:BTB domain-containing protein n=1 Tax=Mycena alexandri TaxID=1745969 RepID=A0AAD6WMP4_9AGAR|nr:hypothetical protein C8F04DRAFT_1151872 [Mycena alexandri]
MSQPPGKRQRTEDAPITRSEFWHTDGSVILQAQNTQFRVHWGVLARNSSFFRDMQSLPQPPDQPTVEGCPVVELPDDEADVEFVLKALYTPTLLAESDLPLSAIGALVRLGHKYEFRDLFDSAVGRLAFENPTSFEEYQARLRLVDLEYNRLWSLLPCACFRLVTARSAAGLFNGLSREDGTLASLSLVDLRRCRLFTKQFESGYTFGWRRGWDFDGCANPPACGYIRTAIVEGYSIHAGLLVFPKELSYIYKHLCPPCCQQLKAAMLAGFKKMWEELPGAFDLPAWNELKNDP